MIIIMKFIMVYTYSAEFIIKNMAYFIWLLNVLLC